MKTFPGRMFIVSTTLRNVSHDINFPDFPGGFPIAGGLQKYPVIPNLLRQELQAVFDHRFLKIPTAYLQKGYQ